MFLDFESLQATWLAHFDLESLLGHHVQKRFLAALDQGRERRRKIMNPAALKGHQQKFRRDFGAMIGGILPVEKRVRATLCGEVKTDGLVVEQLWIPVRKKEKITANLYRPEKASGPLPGILFVCGHSSNGRFYPGYQQVCQILAQSGLVVLAIDPPGQGERIVWPETDRLVSRLGDSTFEHVHLGVAPLLRGENILRYMHHDNQTALTYLTSRSDVDASKLGTTGNSGGGLQSAVLSALDERIGACASGTWLSTLEWILRSGKPQDAEQIWHGYAKAGYDHHDLVLASCPRAFLMLAADDDFFPIEGVLELQDTLHSFWKLSKSTHALQTFRERVPHSYTLSMARAAAKFFARAFGTKSEKSAATPKPIAEEKLRVFPKIESQIPEWARIQGIKSVSSVNTGWLGTRVCHGREKVPCRPRVASIGADIEGLRYEFGWWWTQRHLANLGIVFCKDLQKIPAVRVALWDKGTLAIAEPESKIHAWCDAGDAVLILDVTGHGRLEPWPVIKRFPQRAMFGTQHIFAENLAMLGDELLFMRCWDLLTLPRALKDWPSLAKARILLQPLDRWVIPAMLAAKLESKLRLAPGTDTRAAERFLFTDLPRNSTNLRAFLARGLAG